jgi:hypothetical protein
MGCLPYSSAGASQSSLCCSHEHNCGRWKYHSVLDRQLAPQLVPCCPSSSHFRPGPKTATESTEVSEALHELQWTHDIRGALSVAALAEFIGIVDLLEEVQLLSGVPDKHQWRFSASGQYSSKSAYETFFIGAVHFEPWELIWKSWVPKKCQFFIWLVVHKRCWMADRLATR